MANLERIRVQWAGFTGSPGLSTFYCEDALTLLPAVRTFFNSCASIFPAVCTLSFEPFGAIIEDSTGDLTGAWSTGVTPAVVTGTGGSNYAGATGMMVNWLTTTIVRGRFLRGKTFLIPAVISSGDGTPSPANVAAVQAAATVLAGAAGNLKVWSRPNPDLAYVGTSADVLTGNVPDKAIVLRSRRD